MKINYFNKDKLIRITILCIIALLSMFVIADMASSPQTHLASIQVLDEKKMTVMEMIAASAASSTAISFIPGDAAMPIANQITSISNYLLIVICVIVIEKYLLTITGYVTFKILIPVACLLGAIYLFANKEFLKNLAIKLSIFGLAIFLLVPTSVHITKIVESTYQSSIEETLEEAKNNSEELKTEEEEKGFISSIINSTEKVTSNMLKKVEKTLSDFIDAAAVLIVTSCVIPILVLLGFVWIVKILFNLNISVPKLQLNKSDQVMIEKK